MNRADVLKMMAQSRHANINTILAYLDKKQLFDDHAGQRLLQPAGVLEADDESAQEEGGRGTHPCTV